MIARRSDDVIQIDVTPEELRELMSALERSAMDHTVQASRFTQSARDRRTLADRVKRGRIANQRIAGELDADASRHLDHMKLAWDMHRVLVPILKEILREITLEGGDGHGQG